MNRQHHCGVFFTMEECLRPLRIDSFPSPSLLLTRNYFVLLTCSDGAKQIFLTQ